MRRTHFGPTLLALLALLAGVALVSSSAMAAGGQTALGKGGGGKPPKNPTDTPTGGSSRIAFSAQVSSKGKNKTTSLQVITANPDGSEPVQITSPDTGSNEPLSWSADGWMTVVGEDASGNSLIRILDVPTSGPGAATEVLSFVRSLDSNGAKWSAQEDGNGNVLPASQQLLAFSEGPNGTTNLVLRHHDGTDPVPVTSYVSTCDPEQSPGCSGVRYHVSLHDWLPPDASSSTIRLLYAVTEHTIENGSGTGQTDPQYRVVTLDASNWPAVSVLRDDPLAYGGYSYKELNMNASRDGTLAAYQPAASAAHLLVAPLEYDATTGITTLRTDLEGIRADTSGMEYNTGLFYAGGFSPDNSQLVANGWGEINQFGAVTFSVYAADATTAGSVTEVDGTDRQARAAIWGP